MADHSARLAIDPPIFAGWRRHATDVHGCSKFLRVEWMLSMSGQPPKISFFQELVEKIPQRADDHPA
jgi:hypothetical protein